MPPLLPPPTPSLTGAAKTSIEDAYRNAACTAVQRLAALKSTEARFLLECSEGERVAVGNTVLQSLLLAGYSFDKYMTVDAKKPSFLQVCLM